MEHMKHSFLRSMLPLALCACLMVILVTAIAPTKSARAATSSTASCSNLNMSRGTSWVSEEYVTNHTCRGTSLKLIYQIDGNFVLYIGGQAKWASNTSGGLLDTPAYVEFQQDGNLVVYHINSNGSTVPRWSSRTNGKGAATLALQKDGNLVIYTASGKALWSSHTCCYS